jgi:hypothetical protein
MPYPSVLSPGTSPHSRPSHELPISLPAPGSSAWSRPQPPIRDANPTRPSTNQGRPFTRMAPNHDHIRPTTAPSPLIREMSVGSPRPVQAHIREETSPRGSSIALPPISSITLQDRREGGPQPRMVLPSMHDRPSTRDASSHPPHMYEHYSFGRPSSSSSAHPWYAATTPSEARHKDSISTVASEVLTPMRESGPPFDRPLTGTGMGLGFGHSHISDRPRTGYGSDRPVTSGSYDRPPFGGYDKHSATTYMWDRPQTAGSGSHVSFETTEREREVHPRPYLSPQTTTHPRLSTASYHSGVQANYSRVLVGSLSAACQRLTDENGETGLFFFAHDLGVRTEGAFTLKFTLTDLTSWVPSPRTTSKESGLTTRLMRRSVMPGEKVRVLAETSSSPFTVLYVSPSA